MNILGIMSSQSGESLYQQWAGYPESPRLTSLFPFQAIVSMGATTYLAIGTSDFTALNLSNDAYNAYLNQLNSGEFYTYTLNAGAWVQDNHDTYGKSMVFKPSGTHCTPRESNTTIYTSDAKTATYFAKTT